VTVEAVVKVTAVSTPAFPPQRVEGAVVWTRPVEGRQLLLLAGITKDWAGALTVMDWEPPLGQRTDSCITVLISDTVTDIEFGSVTATS